MCLRISSASGWLLVLAGCASESPPPEGMMIDCAIGAGADFSAACTLEEVAQGRQIILHHPDGGFRRLAYDPASAVLAAGDGAEPLVPQEAEPGVIAFALGADRYRIPRALLGPPAP
jgi:hypothetical protein